MNTVNTVLGPISPDRLGKALVHEHILVGFTGWYVLNSVTPFDKKATEEESPTRGEPREP